MKPETNYILAPNVFMTTAGEHCVFLDLRVDRYFLLDRNRSEVVRTRLRDPSNPLSTGESAPKGGNSCGDAVLATLADRGLLVQCEDSEKAIPRVMLPAPQSALRPDLVHAPLRAVQVRRFFLSAVRASANLRWQSIERTVHTVSRMRPGNIELSGIDDIERLGVLTGEFQRLRPFYPRPYLCLFDSLALLYFLSHYSLFPRWVFAVKLQPFSAHCWVQTAGQVVNDRLGNIRPYSPIMCV